MSQKWTVGLLAGLALAWFTPHAHAGILYATDANGNTGSSSSLYTVDTTTGATSLIGSTGIVVNGLEYHNGTLYATERNDGGLYTLDTSSGASSLVGGFGAHGSGTPVLLAIDSSGNGYTWVEGNDDLATIDLTTGTVSILGDSGISTYEHGLAFLGSTLYQHNGDGDVHTVDTTTGAATSVGNTGVSAHHGSVDPTTGEYYGIEYSEPVINIVDLATATPLGSITTDRELHTLAFAEEAAVPEPGTLAVLGFGLAGLGFFGWRRRNAA
jgi:outer membrane protein assembly factor BamB